MNDCISAWPTINYFDKDWGAEVEGGVTLELSFVHEEGDGICDCIDYKYRNRRLILRKRPLDLFTRFNERNNIERSHQMNPFQDLLIRLIPRKQ